MLIWGPILVWQSTHMGLLNPLGVTNLRQDNITHPLQSSSAFPMSSSSQEYISKSSLFPFQNLEWAPKCPCGYGYMILMTSRTTSNPGRKFWKCPNLHQEKGCGLFIWMDEVAQKCIPMSTLSQDQIEVKMEEMKDSIKELGIEIRRLSERMETHIMGSR